MMLLKRLGILLGDMAIIFVISYFLVENWWVIAIITLLVGFLSWQYKYW